MFPGGLYRATKKKFPDLLWAVPIPSSLEPLHTSWLKWPVKSVGSWAFEGDSRKIKRDALYRQTLLAVVSSQDDGKKMCSSVRYDTDEF